MLIAVVLGLVFRKRVARVLLGKSGKISDYEVSLGSCACLRCACV